MDHCPLFLIHDWQIPEKVIILSPPPPTGTFEGGRQENNTFIQHEKGLFSMPALIPYIVVGITPDTLGRIFSLQGAFLLLEFVRFITVRMQKKQ
jgi:hypothetical protein